MRYGMPDAILRSVHPGLFFGEHLLSDRCASVTVPGT